MAGGATPSHSIVRMRSGGVLTSMDSGSLLFVRIGPMCQWPEKCLLGARRGRLGRVVFYVLLPHPLKKASGTPALYYRSGPPCREFGGWSAVSTSESSTGNEKGRFGGLLGCLERVKGTSPILEEAIDQEIYYRGTRDGHPLILTHDEKQDLLAFLRSLTSYTPSAATAK